MSYYSSFDNHVYTSPSSSPFLPSLLSPVADTRGTAGPQYGIRPTPCLKKKQGRRYTPLERSHTLPSLATVKVPSYLAAAFPMTGNQGKLQSSNAIPSASSSSQSTTEQSQVDKHQVLDTSTSVNDAQSLVQGVAVLLPLSKALPMTSKAGEGTPSPSLMQSDQQINAVASNSSPSSSTPTLVSVGHVSNLALVSPSHLQNADEDQARTITRTRKKRTIEDFV